METLETIKQGLQALPAWQIGAILLAAVFLIIGLRLVFKRPPAHLTAFTGDAGNVLVSRRALQDLVKQACLLDEWVEGARPIIRVKGNKVTARVELRLARAENLKAICERVQKHITDLLQKSLSFEQIGEIQIIVKSFRSDTESPSTSPESGPNSQPLTGTFTPKSDAASDSPAENSPRGSA